METGIEIIAKERKRQIEEEGYTSENDDKEFYDDLSDAAAIYAMNKGDRTLMIEDGDSIINTIWPWDIKYYKPTNNRIHELAKAGALIAAEIDKLLRLKK
jgi:hypothetical protein